MNKVYARKLFSLVSYLCLGETSRCSLQSPARKTQTRKVLLLFGRDRRQGEILGKRVKRVWKLSLHLSCNLASFPSLEDGPNIPVSYPCFIPWIDDRSCQLLVLLSVWKL